MPSPRWPTRVIASRSTTVSSEQELGVALAARKRRGYDAGDFPAERCDEGRDIVADRRVDLRVAHDAFLGLAAAGLELRFDQGHECCRGPRECQRRRQHEL